MNFIKKTSQTLGSLVAVLLASSAALAADLQSGINEAQPSHVPTTLFGAGGIFHKIANVAIGLVGAVAVLMLIYGGVLYVTSAGDAKRVTQAKDTILYAIIGIVVAILAFAIVSFVTKSLTPPPPPPAP